MNGKKMTWCHTSPFLDISLIILLFTNVSFTPSTLFQLFHLYFKHFLLCYHSFSLSCFFSSFSHLFFFFMFSNFIFNASLLSCTSLTCTFLLKCYTAYFILQLYPVLVYSVLSTCPFSEKKITLKQMLIILIFV